MGLVLLEHELLKASHHSLKKPRKGSWMVRGERPCWTSQPPPSAQLIAARLLWHWEAEPPAEPSLPQNCEKQKLLVCFFFKDTDF